MAPDRTTVERPSDNGRPRVVHVTTSHRADDVRIFEREARSLAACGKYEVFLAAHGAIPDGSGVILLPFPTPPANRLQRFTSGPRKARALSRSVAADLWHFHDPELLPVAITLARAGQRVIWDAHEDYLAQFGEDGAKSWLPRAARPLAKAGIGALLSQIDKHAGGIVAATPTIAARYRNPRTVVVGNEARLEDFTHCQPDFSSKRLLFTGSARGSHHLFPEIVEAVAGIPGVTLVIAGREPHPDIWSSAQQQLGQRLKHVGWLDRAAMAREMSRSTLGFSTYADLATNADNRPNKMFEFGAAGLPVVASPNRSNVEFVNHGAGAHLAAAFTAEALREAIVTAISDQDSWTAASVKARDWAAREGSWESSEARLLDLYGQLIGGERRPR